jgi:glutamate/tyrosine decarboxylase-like PLP-dependent enzyme
VSLDADPVTFRRWLHRASDEVVRVHAGLDRLPAKRWRTPEELRATFDRPLPASGADLDELIPEVCEELLDASALNLGPRFFGYVISSGNQVGAVAELLQGGLNLCPSKWDVSAAGTEVERCAVRWIAEFIGLPAATGGALVSGGTVANLTGLAAARTAVLGPDVGCTGLRGLPRLVVYTSSEAHACHERNLDLLGLGRDQLVKVDVRTDLSVDCDALAERIRADRAAGDRPFCVIGTAGTTNTGAVDDLERLANLCAREDLWLHVDGAYGAPAARTASAGHLFRGLERADSIALDPHKWLFAPLEAGCVLVRDHDLLRRSFGVDCDYLSSVEGAPSAGGLDWFEHTLQHTRDLRALKIWLAFRVYGADRIRAAIEDNIATMRHLGELIEASEDVELLAPVQLSTVCFRYRTADPGLHGDERSLDDLNVRLRAAIERDDRIHLPGTRVGGRQALRACTVNHRTTRAHAEEVLDVVRELGAEVALEPGALTR